jgi:MoxR-like ATPase
MQYQQVKASMACFGPQYATASVVGFESNSSPLNVPIDAGYLFQDLDAMRIMVAAWNREWTRPEEAHRKGVLFFGPTGSGKSSFVEQFFARLNVPLARITWTPRKEASELLTDRVLVDGTLLDRDQVLVIAARQGVPVLINEIDLADPAELVSLNDIIERGVITLASGEIVKANRGFMVFATANTAGIEDADGVYHGTQAQNASTLRRFFKAELGYPSEIQEREFLDKAAQHCDPLIRAIVAKMATKIRQAFAGTLDGVCLSKPISRPEMVDWAMLAAQFGYLHNQGINPLEYAMGFAFANGAPAGDQAAIKLMLEQVTAQAAVEDVQA